MARLLAVAGLLALLPTLPAAEFEKFLLNDSDAFIAVNVRQVAASAAFKKHYQAPIQDWLKEPGEAPKALAAMGLDPVKDIDWLLLANGESLYKVQRKIIAGKLDIDRQTSVFLLIEGRFNPARIKTWAEQYAKDQPGTLKAHAGGIYELNLGRPVFAAVLNPSLAAVSLTREPLAEALEKVAGKRKTTAKFKDVFAAAAKLDAKQSVTFFASGNMVFGMDVDVVKVGNKLVDRPVKLTLTESNIDGIRGQITLTEGLAADITVSVRDAATGKAVAESLAKDQSDTLELAFAAIVKYKQVAPLFDLVRVIKTETPNAKTVRIHAMLSADDLAKSLK